MKTEQSTTRYPQDIHEKEIYIVELIVSSICATVLFVADILSVFTSSNIARLEFSDKVNVTEFAFHLCDCFCVHHHSICFVHYDCNDFT